MEPLKLKREKVVGTDFALDLTKTYADADSNSNALPLYMLPWLEPTASFSFLFFQPTIAPLEILPSSLG